MMSKPVTDESDDDGGILRTYSIKRSTYIRPSTDRGIGIEGQPHLQWYFHRSIQDIAGVFFEAGWVIDGIEEPVLERSESPFAEIPGVLVLRFVKR